MHLAVIIPCFNEEPTIEEVIRNIPERIENINRISTIVVDDGSTDKTSEIAEKTGSFVIRHCRNQGVGMAFHSGLRKAIEINADFIVNIDGDGQFNPEDIKKILLPVIHKKADFVTASRFINPEFYPDMPLVKLWGNKVMSRIISRITKEKFYDVSCGFRAYTRDAALKLNLFGKFTYTQESFINLAFKNLKIIEIPVKIKGVREHGQSRVASNLFRYAFQTLRIIFSTYRDYKPFRLFGWIGLLNLIIGIGFSIFLFIHYLRAGEFTPFKWTGFAGGFFIILGLIFFLLGFILDMFTRMRQNQEMILYYMQKQISE